MMESVSLGAAYPVPRRRCWHNLESEAVTVEEWSTEAQVRRLHESRDQCFRGFAGFMGLMGVCLVGMKMVPGTSTLNFLA